MKKSFIIPSWLLIVTFILLFSNLYGKKRKLLPEPLVRERLHELDTLQDFSMVYHVKVNEYIGRYVFTGHKEAEKLLGKTAIYFPIFEHYLKLYDLPDFLKYLPLLESRLNPTAESFAGAVGLWQFSVPTARQYGLKINAEVDERKDPYKSTEAAVRFLKDMYSRLGDWSLVLAAYNCGAGRVAKSSKESGSAEYWQMRHHLPTETQNFIPAFIATVYLCHYYYYHDIEPIYPDYTLQFTEVYQVYDRIDLTALAKRTKLPLGLLEQLNPSYHKGIIPRDTKGSFLILPQEVILSERSQAGIILANYQEETSDLYKKEVYKVNTGDCLGIFSYLFDCTIEQLEEWNNLNDEQLFINQQIIVYHHITEDKVEGL